MRASKAMGLVGLSLALAAARGCGGSGQDLFAGTVEGAGGAEADASAGGSAGTGGELSGGSAGTGGQGGGPEAGDDGQAGSSQEAGEAEAAAGSGGGSPPSDCKAECPKDCPASGAVTEQGCADCVKAVCLQQYAALNGAPESSQFLACAHGCAGEQGCLDGCCQQHEQACTTAMVFQECMCGHPNPDCKPVCQTLCGGGTFGSECTQCALHSTCGDEIAAFMYADGNDAYFPCVQDCEGDAACKDDCCAESPEACQSRNATVACICQ